VNANVGSAITGIVIATAVVADTIATEAMTITKEAVAVVATRIPNIVPVAPGGARKAASPCARVAEQATTRLLDSNADIAPEKSKRQN
jgi:hypothetical protein